MFPELPMYRLLGRSRLGLQLLILGYVAYHGGAGESRPLGKEGSVYEAHRVVGHGGVGDGGDDGCHGGCGICPANRL
jgi:hypothetical protein